MTTFQLISVHVGAPALLGERRGETVISGIRKLPVSTHMVDMSTTNISGDGQADLQNHGGIDKAVYCYSADNYEYWKESIGYQGDGIHASFGQNLTVSGVDETQVCIGDLWRWGDVTLEVSQPRWPCFKLNMHSGVKRLSNEMIHSGRSGWYLRVVDAGSAPTSGEIVVFKRDSLQQTVRETFEARANPKMDAERYREIMAHPRLANGWRS